MPTHLDMPPDLPWSRIPARARWDDLVLPAEVARELRAIAQHWRQQRRLRDGTASSAFLDTSRSVLALFSGPPGTGKTMAAEVLANELALDLYRIDLSQVVSKYIGETEKNLARLFEAAEQGGVLLLFDEADALFGKRSEAKDSHDRYANAEVRFLLQRIEQFAGLAILTTNRRHALDPAFIRRLHYVVEFPFPDPETRHHLWRRVFPPDVECRDIDFDCLAQVELTGRAIRDIARHVIRGAASNASPVTTAAVLEASAAELGKYGRIRSTGRV